MCLIVFDWQPAASQENGRALLTLSANRDEFFRRDAEPMHWWQDAPDVLAGRDLTGGGTWLGVSRRSTICRAWRAKGIGITGSICFAATSCGANSAGTAIVPTRRPLCSMQACTVCRTAC